MDSRRFVVLGNPDSRRVLLFQEALAATGLRPATVVAWSDFLAGRADFSAQVPPGAWVRIESPGKDFPVEQALLALGAEIGCLESAECRTTPENMRAYAGNLPGSDNASSSGAHTAWNSSAASNRYAGASAGEIAALNFDTGRILYPNQWFLGFCEALRQAEAQLSVAPPHHRMQASAEILTMFDKNACHARLQAAGIAVPRALAPVRSYNELLERMQEAGVRRVFVKLTHGSSASGVVAYRTNGRQHQATTTVEMMEQEGELRLYNSRRLQTYTDSQQIAALIDALCCHRVHVEEWIPKAGFAGKTFDLRVVVIAGHVQHIVVRQSHTPITNLHLLNVRGDWAALKTELGEAAWGAARETCEAAMRCFPSSLYAGIDLMFTPGFRRHAILEVNAFGDLLPGILHQGRDTYAAEIAAALRIAEERPCFRPAT